MSAGVYGTGWVESPPTRVGILGGTFDPPHAGHMMMAKIALAEGVVDAVWFLPCWKHAFGKNPTSFIDRLSMCHLMVKDEPCVEVCMDEYFIESTYTVEVLEYMRSKHSDKTLRLMLGADNYWRMDEWKRPKKIVALAPPIWFERPGVKSLPLSEEVLPNCADFSSTNVRRDAREGNFFRVNVATNSSIVKYINNKGLYR